MTVRWSDINSAYTAQFKRIQVPVIKQEYDPLSVMHYDSALGMAKPGKPTLVPKKGRLLRLREKPGLSAIDIKSILGLYAKECAAESNSRRDT